MQYLYVQVGENNFLKDVSNKALDGYEQKPVSEVDVSKILEHPQSFYVDSGGVVTRQGWPDGGYPSMESKIKDLTSQMSEANNTIKNLSSQLQQANADKAALQKQIQGLQMSNTNATQQVTKISYMMNHQTSNNNQAQNQTTNSNK